jgi:hypothetical protein
MNSRPTPARLATVALALLAAGSAASAHHDPKACSAATLQGDYVFHASGHTLVGGAWAPKAIVEQMRFAADGTVTVLSATIANRFGNGLVEQLPPGVVTGTFTVDAGCTGSLKFGPAPVFDFVIDPRGERLWVIQNNPNNVFEGEMRRLSK